VEGRGDGSVIGSFLSSVGCGVCGRGGWGCLEAPGNNWQVTALDIPFATKHQHSLTLAQLLSLSVLYVVPL
jgi:hypothetical protein